MSKKENIVTTNTLAWDELMGKTVDESLAIVYERIKNTSNQMCDWYWKSIKAKKKMSLLARVFGVVFLVIGTILPVLSALWKDDHDKLAFTQFGVAALAFAGLWTLVDRIFGWSSGWMRYIVTVTSMENLIKIYHWEWGNYIASKESPLEKSDLKTLFDMTIALQNELIKLLSDETSKWVVEFNASISLLESAIKAQREANEKQQEAIRTNLSDKRKEEDKKSDEAAKAKENGQIQVNFSYQNKPKKLKLQLDNSKPEEFEGLSWAKLGVTPGPHILRIEVEGISPVRIERVLDVKPASTVEVSVKIDV